MAKSLFNKFMAFMLIALAAVSCTDDDVANTERSSRSYAKSEEVSDLTKDDYHHTATLQVTVTNTDPQGIETSLNGDATAKVTASVESDPIETSNMEKSFAVGEINTVEQNGNDVATCNIAVNGTENNIPVRVVMERCDVFDNHYSLKVTDIAVDKANVKLTETSKKSGEKARQAVYVPLNVTIAAVGTKVSRSVVVPTSVTWEQFQKETTPVIDHEEIASATHVITNGKDDYLVKVKQVWTDGSETFVEYPYSATHYFNTISLEDMIVKSWAYSLSKVEGITVGSESKVKEEGFFTEFAREDLYSALHANGQDANIKTVYMAGIPKVVFTKGELSYTFDFISPSFTELVDELLDAQSMKAGYDLRVFRNAIIAKYGNTTTGVDEQTLEERANLYKQAKAVADVEFSGMKKTYGLWTITYDVDCIDVYNDGTKSEKYHLTTSRPWSLTYAGPWSMSTENDVKEVIDAIKLSKTGSKTEDQSISNGKWSCTTTSYDVVNYTTVDGKNQKNAWTASVPTHMILTLHGKTCDFGEDTPAGVAKNDKIELTSSTATSEVYTFSEDLNFTVGDYTTTSQATGTVNKAVEVTVKSWSWENAWQRVEGSVTKAHVDKVYVYTDGSTKTVSRDFTFTRGSQVYTYWETSEANNSETTGAAGWSVLSTEAKTEGDWHFNVVKSQLTFGIACANSNQTDGWNITEANNLSVDIEGDTYTFPAMDYNASANASQSKTAETENQTEYTHSNAPTYNFGGYSMTLSAATGKIFVAKTVIPEHHEGFFPDWYGLLEGDNKAACRNPHNQKDWGVGGSLKFTNGSLPYFISKDGIIEFGEFESGSTVWNASSPDSDGTLKNCNARDASAAMKWVREATINMLSYTDATLMGFNDGHNTVSTSKFAGSIEQHDGGKWQSISFAGARTSDGRTSFDTSF